MAVSSQTVTHRLRSVDLRFLAHAPRRWEWQAEVAASPAAVFGAISADPSTWSWFPGVTSGRYRGDEPHGVGSVREVWMGELLYRETILAWDEPCRWAYRVDESTVDFFDALAEDWVVEDRRDRAVVRWTFAVDPRSDLAEALTDPPALIGDTFQEAMGNLAARLT
jgi:hypothetical protein